MKERPILFKGEMVRALLKDRKTQTRRIVKPQPTGMYRADYEIRSDPYPYFVIDGKEIRCPYGSPGDRLWVRETHYCDVMDCHAQGYNPASDEMWGEKQVNFWRQNMYYRADGECCQLIPECSCAEVGKPEWRPSIHMHRWASRINLEVTGLRIEHVQDISNEDAQSEGVKGMSYSSSYGGFRKDYRRHFEALWNKINQKRGFGWGANPFTWVVEFERIKP